MAGTPVTVWSETRSPRQQWVAYYTQFLNQIGFKATQKVIADATYFTTIGNLKLNPQTGFADWNQDFPNPIDFYLLLQSSGDPADQQPELRSGEGSADRQRVDQARGRRRRASCSTSPRQWQALDQYVAQKAYVGHLRLPDVPGVHVDPDRSRLGRVPSAVRVGLDAR